MKRKIGIITVALIAVVATILGISKISDRISTTYRAKDEIMPYEWTDHGPWRVCLY